MVRRAVLQPIASRLPFSAVLDTLGPIKLRVLGFRWEIYQTPRLLSAQEIRTVRFVVAQMRKAVQICPKLIPMRLATASEQIRRCHGIAIIACKAGRKTFLSMSARLRILFSTPTVPLLCRQMIKDRTEHWYPVIFSTTFQV